MALNLPTLADAKAQAKRLRQDLSADQITHSRALELVAHQYGFNDWNTFHAALGNAKRPDYAPGSRVSGSYLGQAFKGAVVSATLVKTGWYRLVLDLDEAVDVVQFDSFSNMRRRIRGMIGPNGHSPDKTSDGTPHLVVDL